MIYFLSDAHLGSRAIEDAKAHQQRVVNLLRRMEQDAEEVYMLGDMFDFWYEYLWRDRSKEQFRPFLDQLHYMSERGIKIHYFIGNHDIWTFGWLTRQTGVQVHRRGEVVRLYGHNCYLAHGDGLVPSRYAEQLPKPMQRRIRSFMRLRKFFHSPVPQFLYRMVPPCIGNAFGYEWARRSRIRELDHPCAYKGEDKEELVLWAKEHPEYEYCIFGHRHIELDLQLSAKRRIIILGDLFRQYTYASLDSDGTLMLNNIEQ